MSVPPAGSTSGCQAMPWRWAVAFMWATMRVSLITEPSIILTAAPWPSRVTASWGCAPGTSKAIVTSSPIAKAGSICEAAVIAPRRPTSSCTVNTA